MGYIYADQELALPSTGDYFLVESGNGSGDPNYKFRIYAPSLPTTAYTLDSTVSNTLTKKGEYDTYTFNGRSGQRLYFDRLIGNGQITAKLYSPSNVVVASGDLGNDIAPFFLREDGNYRLVIDGSGETTGDYSFRLVNIDTAPTLSLDTPLAAVLNPGTEADFYQFGGAAGERLYFHLGATSWPQGQADWVLYGPDNQALAAPNYFSPDFSVVLPTAGTYVLSVRGYGATPLGYSFTAYTTPISTTNLALGSTVTAALSKPGERDDYTFTGAIGQHLFLDALVGSSSIHARLTAPNGVQLFDNTLDRDGVPIVLTDSGTYRLAIDGNGATTGNYSFRFSDMAAATGLSVGTTTNGSLSSGNSVDLYSYSGREGQTLNFNLGSTTWNGANWVLYDASGAVLAAPNASSPNFQVTLAANGVYTLAIVGSSSNPVNYSFTVTDNSAAATTNSGFGTLQTFSVNSNQVVDDNFTASAGTILFYDSRDEQNGNNYSLRVRLQNPDGTYVFNGQDERYDTAPIVLTQSGNYKLQVYNADTTRVANFQLLELPKTLGPGTNYLQMDSPVTGTLNHAESKVYTFQAVNGLKILLNGMAGATNYTLYDSSGRQVLTQNDSGGYYWIPPVWADTSLETLTQNDLYHLVVSNTSGADNNPYSFEVLETSNVQEVKYGVPVTDSLADGRLDTIYKIKANQGDHLFFDSIATNAPNSNYRWKLYDPGNQLLFNNDLHTSTSVTIAETGYYYLDIEGGPDTNQINYQFRVFSYTPTANTIITPGAGGTNSTDPNGWRMEFRDTDLRTSVGKPSDDLALLGEQNPFKDGTRVYLTLPGGKREGFTFKPTQVQQIDGSSLLFFSKYFYTPTFVADDGVTDTLTVASNFITPGANSNEYYGFQGNPYNPADPLFGGIYTLTTKEGVKYEIDASSGKLLTVTDTNGNKLTYTDADITSSTGQKITFGRDAQGRITSVTDPMGKEIQYQYDSNGDLVAVTDRSGNKTQFVYDTTRAHFLDNVIDPLGRTGVRNQYGDDGRLTQILDANGKAVQLAYDPSHSTETVNDALGNPTTYEYDERGNVVQEIDALGGVTKRTYDQNNNKLTQTDPDGVSTTYTYDSKGNPLTLTDLDGNVTRITYNQYGETLNIISPRGLTVSSTYDGQGNLLSRTNTDGQTTTFNYDGFGRLIKQTAPDGEVSTYTYDSWGNPIIFTDSRGNQAISTYDLNGKVKTLSMVFPKENQTLTTSYTYDNQGHTTSVTDPQGNVSTTEYDAKGDVIATTDTRGNRTQYFYDDKGQQVKVILPDNTPNNPDDNPVVLTEYDAAGRVISQTSATGLKTRYVYDALGRLTDTILPDLTPNNPNDNPDEKIEYTAADRIKAKTDIFGTRTEYTYDTLGRVSRERDFFGNSAGNDTTYTYNADGQVTSVTDARNRTTLFGIDEFGRPSVTTYFDGTTSQVTYDANGRTKSETNQLGQTTNYSYDAFGKVSAITNPLNQQTQFTYNSRGSLVKVTDALNHSTQYTYDQYNRQTAVIDANGNRTETTYDQYGEVTATEDANQHTTQYFYDNKGELTAVKLANQATTNYTYDNLGRRSQVEDANHNKTTYSYDAFNRQIATNLPLGQRSTTTYNNLGLLANTSDFNGDVITYSYDQYGRLANKSFSNPLVAGVAYTYDPVTSQVKTVTDGRGVTTYGFDNYDRVNLISNPDGQTVGYTYDVLGNLKTLTTSGSTVNYSYDKLNRLDTVTSGGQLAKYGYDAVGDLISTTLGDGTIETRSYDASNRLTGISTRDASGAVLSSYAYTLDGVGERTQVVENTGRTVNYT